MTHILIMRFERLFLCLYSFYFSDFNIISIFITNKNIYLILSWILFYILEDIIYLSYRLTMLNTTFFFFVLRMHLTLSA